MTKNSKANCWLCGRGHGIDNGDLVPGELKLNLFGDMECIYCTARLNLTVKLMDKPELIQPMIEIGKLGYMVVKK